MLNKIARNELFYTCINKNEEKLWLKRETFILILSYSYFNYKIYILCVEHYKSFKIFYSFSMNKHFISNQY